MSQENVELIREMQEGWNRGETAVREWLLEAGHDHFAVSVQLGHEDGGALVMSPDGRPPKDAALERLLAGFRPAGQSTGSRTGSTLP
jgi:hypothetical protein